MYGIPTNSGAAVSVLGGGKRHPPSPPLSMPFADRPTKLRGCGALEGVYTQLLRGECTSSPSLRSHRVP